MNKVYSTDVINRVDDLFSKAEVIYEDFFVNEIKNPINFRQQWENSPFNSPILDVTTYLAKLYKTKIFSEEINKNIINGSTEYFIYVRNIVNRRFNFINQYFSHAINFFFHQPKRSDELIKFLNDKKDLSNNDFLLAVQLDFVDKCQLLETVLKRYYADYLPVLTNYYDIQAKSYTEPIKLDYKINNSVVIKELYEILHQNFISNSFSDFQVHFDQQNGTIEKIKWNGTITLLCVLFSSVQLKDKYTTQVKGLSTINSNTEKMICDHFCDKDGLDYSKEVVRVTLSKLIIKNVQGLKSLIAPLKKIEISYNNL